MPTGAKISRATGTPDLPLKCHCALPPQRTPDRNQHVPANGAFDVFYVPLVYVNMNKGTFSLGCCSQLGAVNLQQGCFWRQGTSNLYKIPLVYAYFKYRFFESQD